MMLAITSLYAALLAFVFLALTFRVIAYRRGKQISLGDKGDPAMTTRMRAHGNFAEYVPLALILLALVEMSGAPALAVHLLGLLLLAGRILHGIGFWGDRPVMWLRQYGMMATLIMILAAALGLLGHSLF